VVGGGGAPGKPLGLTAGGGGGGTPGKPLGWVLLFLLLGLLCLAFCVRAARLD